MDEREMFDKINGMLEDTDYPIRITSMSDIADFLMDDSNRRFAEQYAVIGRMYDDIQGRPDRDRYLDASIVKAEEQEKV
ncbi:MAG: hypothetical protein N2645_22090 [Clostridia bacterium]|nr:hypothetical protein [Clostridia bacterium]